MELDYIILGKRIADRRKQKQIKQKTMAEAIGISNNYLSGIERGREKPLLELVIKICNYLEVTPDYLLLGAMHSSTIPQNIADSLRLCEEHDIALVDYLVHYLAERGQKSKSNKY